MLSSAAVSGSVSGSSSPRTLQLHGTLMGRELLILIDSGSSHSFFSTRCAQGLQNLVTLPKPVTVKVADGGSIVCNSEVQGAEWIVQGYSFHSNLRILQLGSYDMIVGMDWLEAFSPMKVDWRHKWMSIPYGQSSVVLQGLLPDSIQTLVLQLCHIVASSHSTEPSEIPEVVQQLIEEFSDLFQDPSDLPPRRHCDHRIPLITGASPVAIRQYRYTNSHQLLALLL